MNPQRVALVTGASSGIGRATALLLSERGFRVFGTTRNPAGAGERLGPVTLIQLDVRSDESVGSCVDAVLAQTGRIDALVNNAGYALIGSAEETSLHEAKELFETNFFGVLRMNQAVLPIMRRQGFGRIAIVGSVVGFLPAPYQAIYAASKHAIEGYSESLDHEVRQFGTRVAVIEPGFTRTNLAENSQLATRRLGAYTKDRDCVVSAIRESVAKGEDVARVAAAIFGALTAKSPRMRYPAGRQARLLSVLRKFAPASLFAKGLRKQFGLEVA